MKVFVLFCIGLAGTYLIYSIIALCCRIYQRIGDKYAFLEITFPDTYVSSMDFMQEFYAFFYHLPSTWWRWFVRYTPLYSMELIATKEDGIRYVLCVPCPTKDSIKRMVRSTIPMVKIHEINDPYVKILQKKQDIYTARKSYSLFPQRKHAMYDFMEAVTNTMEGLKEDEIMTMQVLFSPIFFKQLAIGSLVVLSVIRSFRSILSIFLFLVFSNVSGRKRKESTKISEETFHVSCKILVPKNVQPPRMQGIKAALASSLNQKLVFRKEFIPLLGRILFVKRFSISFPHIILSNTELASLFHFPFTDSFYLKELIRTKVKSFPPDFRTKNEEKIDVPMGQATSGDMQHTIGLTKEERLRHVYIIGATGTGKSTLLSSMIHADMENGKGLCVLDPHGDLSEELVSKIPDSRIQDVIYFDPSDTAFPIGINIFELPKEGHIHTDEKDLIANGMISLFTKLYPPRYLGPRMEHILRSAVLTILETPDPTVFSLQRLLIDTKYRKGIVETLQDPILKLFWTKEFQQMGSYQKADAVSPITNKLGRFITSSITRNILGQPSSSIHFDTLMQEGKILICNLAKGNIGEDVTTLLGSMLVIKLQLAALRRVQIPEDKRKDFFFYIDEFQNFASQSFAQMLSESRKYHLGAILAHQTTAQIDKGLLQVILANAGNIVTFRTGSPNDERMLLPFFAPYVTKGDIRNLANFNFFLKINSPYPTDVMSLKTDIAYKNRVNGNGKEEVIRIAREQYATTKEVVEAHINEFFKDFTKKRRTKEMYLQESASILQDDS